MVESADYSNSELDHISSLYNVPVFREVYDNIRKLDESKEVPVCGIWCESTVPSRNEIRLLDEFVDKKRRSNFLPSSLQTDNAKYVRGYNPIIFKKLQEGLWSARRHIQDNSVWMEPMALAELLKKL